MEDKDQKEQFISLDNLLEILGNPTRRIILAKLAKVPHSASELAHSLNISRQAVHSQLKILAENDLIENMDPPDLRGGKYRIKSNVSVRIDMTPDYYNVNYNMTKINKLEPIQLKDIGYDIDYKKIKNPNEKIKFLGVKMKKIAQDIRTMEEERSELLHNKEGLIVELKNVMKEEYEKQFRKEQPNLEKEIFFTLFYDPMKYFKKINIDSLIDDMFFSDMDLIRRDQHRVSVDHLLRDLSSLMDIFREDEDDWFFDI